ncbi:(R)-mandelonitrile lyase [Fibrella forsythiae]|uniref:Cupin domain-containing protein n=1 Tax=Fibrella forsythiae TaxID=2817061 RepID=A0ABS3JIJ4_9BACT|nr:cupin domain-containing protein [Fibrella forsythiae]MBO0949834.1 cupin domain-containing protein [Fibrella forsythiae]
MDQTDKSQPTAPQGATQAPADYFTGIAWIKSLVPANDLTDCTVSEVTFEPGTRNNWHTHPNGQILIVTAGTCYYQEQGKPIRHLQEGQAVNIAPDLVHWHGASPNSRMTHLAINPNVSKGGAVNWLQPVTDAEYNHLPHP